MVRTVILAMLRKPVAQGLIEKLADDSAIRAVYESDYSKAEDAIRSCNADAALIEITETEKYNVSYCLALCLQLRETIPSCKLMLLCPEHDDEAISSAVRAKQRGDIEDFLFYDSSLDYLTSKLISVGA